VLPDLKVTRALRDLRAREIQVQPVPKAEKEIPEQQDLKAIQALV